MKKNKMLLILALHAFVFLGCTLLATGESGTLSMSITDAPSDHSTVEGVFLTVQEIQYHMNNEVGWQIFKGFSGPYTFNILELQNGESAFLGEMDLPAGRITQIRFVLDLPLLHSGTPSNPGCFVRFNDGSPDAPIYIPASVEEVGFKFTGSFEVPVNGEVEIITDFDVRKSLLLLNNGNYFLQPTVRMLIESETGRIIGNLLNPDEDTEYIVFVYRNGTYIYSEADIPEEGEVQFPNAESSDLVEDSDGDGTLEYVLPYLELDIYDLVVTKKSSVEGVLDYVGILEDINLNVNGTVSADIDLSTL